MCAQRKDASESLAGHKMIVGPAPSSHSDTSSTKASSTRHSHALRVLVTSHPRGAVSDRNMDDEICHLITGALDDRVLDR